VDKPVLAGWIIAPSLARTGMRRLLEGRIPIYGSPDRVVLALRALADWAALGVEAGMPAAAGR
jgi:hypothetical protein